MDKRLKDVPPILKGKRALIVEDEMLVALLIEDFLEELGCQHHVGPYCDIRGALEAIDEEKPDIALLDINLDGEMSFPIAEALERRRVPFLMITGYGPGAVGARQRRWPVLVKPFTLEGLAAALGQVLLRPL